MSSNPLVLFDRARQALAQARSIDEVKLVRDQAEALRLYVRQQGEGLEMQNDIAEIKLRAERRAGELLYAMPKNKGTAGTGRPTLGGSNMEPPKDPVPARVWGKPSISCRHTCAYTRHSVHFAYP